jgi:hypothetical protein
MSQAEAAQVILLPENVNFDEKHVRIDFPKSQDVTPKARIHLKYPHSPKP